MRNRAVIPVLILFSSLGSTLAQGIASTPMIVMNADGRLEMFALFTDNSVQHAWQLTAGGAWSGWQQLSGGTSVAPPTVVLTGDGRLEAFVLDGGGSGALWSNWQTSPGGGWSG